MNRREALTALMTLPEATRVTVARPKPDDVIIVELSRPVRLEEQARLRALLVDVWPERRIVICPPELRIKFGQV